MNINVSGINIKHEDAINKGFAPWNIYRKFKFKDGSVVILTGIKYEAGGDVEILIEATGVSIKKTISHFGDLLSDYEMIEE